MRKTKSPEGIHLSEGTREEHLACLRRAKANGVTSIWSGGLRNRFLFENLRFGEAEGILSLTAYVNYEAQESGYSIKWLKDP